MPEVGDDVAHDVAEGAVEEALHERGRLAWGHHRSKEYIVIQHSHDVTPVDAPVVCGDLTPRARISRPFGGRSIREADPVCANGLARLSVSRRWRRRKDTRYLSSADGQRAGSEGSSREVKFPSVAHAPSSD